MLAAEVAKRYAQGLFLLAQEKNALDQVAAEMKDLDELLQEDDTLLDFLAAPQVRDQDKFSVLRSVFSGKVSRMLEEFLTLVVAKRRNPYIHEIAEAFEELVLDHNGFVKSQIITAVTLSRGETDKMQEKLEAKSGKKVMIVTKVDPSIIGGVIVILGDQIIDKSIRHQLELLRDQLKALKVH